MEPLVSVIIPVYNVSPYLRECLDSAIHQTYRNLEILVIDDGSTDGSGRICDEYQAMDSRVQVFHQENRGLSAARNVGLDHMTGNLVAFLDSDDACRPDMIGFMVDAMTQSVADMVVCGYSFHTDTDEPLALSKASYHYTYRDETISSREALNRLVTKKLNCSVWNKLYRAHLWKGIRFPNGRVYEDIHVCYQILLCCKLIRLSQRELYCYRKRSGSITQTHTVQNETDHFLAMEMLQDFVIEHTPDVFSVEARDIYLENSLRKRMIVCAEMMRHASGEDKGTVSSIRNDLLEHAGHMKLRMLKTRAVYALLRFSPGLIIQTRRVYQFCKRFFFPAPGTP